MFHVKIQSVSNQLLINPHDENEYFSQFTGNYNDVSRSCVDENAKVILNSTSENYECQCTQGYEMGTKSRICEKIEGRLLAFKSS